MTHLLSTSAAAIARLAKTARGVACPARPDPRQIIADNGGHDAETGKALDTPIRETPTGPGDRE
jgi:hypothetical protein